MANLIRHFAVIGLLIIPTFSSARSLDDAFSAQQQEEISPVTAGGKSLLEEASAAVCSVLGYSRIVTYEVEPCKNGEQLFYYVEGYGGSVPVLSTFNKCKNGNLKRLKSVTCAK